MIWLSESPSSQPCSRSCVRTRAAVVINSVRRHGSAVTNSSATLAAALAAAGVGAKRYYATPLHRQPAMRPWSDVALPGTDRAAREHLAIPMSPVLTREQAGEVVAAVRDADLG